MHGKGFFRDWSLVLATVTFFPIWRVVHVVSGPGGVCCNSDTTRPSTDTTRPPPHIGTAYKGRRMIFLLGESDLDTCQGTGRGNIPKLIVLSASDPR